jgi:hypothetical protein
MIEKENPENSDNPEAHRSLSIVYSVMLGSALVTGTFLALSSISPIQNNRTEEQGNDIKGKAIAWEYTPPKISEHEDSLYPGKALILEDSVLHLTVETESNGTYTAQVNDSYRLEKEAVRYSLERTGINSLVELRWKSYSQYPPGSIFGIDADNIINLEDAKLKEELTK